MKVICDTNIFISLFENYTDTIEEVKAIGDENVLMPVVTYMELIGGMPDKKSMNQMLQKIKHYNILHFDERVSIKAAELMHDYKLNNSLQIPDAIIGAMAIIYNLPLHSYNKKDFRFMPGLNFYSVNH